MEGIEGESDAVWMVQYGQGNGFALGGRVDCDDTAGDAGVWLAEVL